MGCKMSLSLTEGKNANMAGIEPVLSGEWTKSDTIELKVIVSSSFEGELIVFMLGIFFSSFW